MVACERALELNERLIASDQHEYHMSLRANFAELVKELTQWLRDDGGEHNHAGEKNEKESEAKCTNSAEGDGQSGSAPNSDDNYAKRLSCHSFEIFDYISGSSTA